MPKIIKKYHAVLQSHCKNRRMQCFASQCIITRFGHYRRAGGVLQSVGPSVGVFVHRSVLKMIRFSSTKLNDNDK